jgi:hypothetical protein
MQNAEAANALSGRATPATSHRRLYRAVLGVAALSVAALTATTAMATPLAFVSTDIGSNFRYFDPPFSENLDIPIVETNNTGAPIDVTNFHAAGAAPSFGSARSFGSADLQTGHLAASARASISRDGTRFEQFNISTSVTAGFGDAFETTTGGGNPYVWDGSGKGKFTIDVSGILKKENQDGDGLLNVGRMGYTIRLVVMGTNGERGVCDWRRRVGGFDTDMPDLPFRDVSAVSNEGTSNVCNSSGEIFLGVGGSLRLEALVDVGADFEWILSLATNAVVGGQVDAVEANFANSLDVSYEGPAGTFTAADVFDGIVGDGDPDDPDDPDDPPVTVPAPATLVLLGTGLALLSARRRLRRHGDGRPIPQALESSR